MNSVTLFSRIHAEMARQPVRPGDTLAFRSEPGFIVTVEAFNDDNTVIVTAGQSLKLAALTESYFASYARTAM